MSGTGARIATRRGALLLAMAAGGAARAAPGVGMEVWKDPDCGCCVLWARHMRDAGFAVTLHDTGDLGPLKRAHAIPEALWSCHTALAGGYVVEGHIPAAIVQRLLAERPAIRGIALPGMPSGSPGMEGPKAGPFTIWALPADRAAAPVVHAVA